MLTTEQIENVSKKIILALKAENITAIEGLGILEATKFKILIEES